MDGGPQLRAALGQVRARASDVPDPLVIVTNGTRGPSILDTRSLPGAWVIEGLLPTGIVAALCDLDDPSTQTLLENGFDVVLRLHGRGAMDDAPVLFSAHWRDGLVPGVEPLVPFWVRFDPACGRFVRSDDPDLAAEQRDEPGPPPDDAEGVPY
jgi:hypothetical protein